MAVKIPEPERIDAHDSTWIELDGAGEIQKIETFPRFRTEWRGVPVVVTMACDRYRAGMDLDTAQLTPWRYYASEARAYDRDGEQPLAFYRGAEVTETARRRLSDACRPITAAWLQSEAFAARTRQAIAAAILRELTGSRTDATRARRFVHKWRNELDADRVELLLAACDARDTYDAAVEKAGA